MVDFLKDWGGLILSLLGIISGVYAYLRHDRKLKTQEKKLNDLQIKQYEEQEAKEKKAEFHAHVVHTPKGMSMIRFENTGKADATNVRVEILTSKSELATVDLMKSWGPYNLINSQSYREEQLILYVGRPGIISIKITWDDAYEKDRTSILSVPI